MLTTTIILNEDFHGHLLLGRSGEHLVRRIEMDITYFVTTFGEGMPYLLHKRKGDTAPYPVALQRTGNILTWEITRSDNAVPGHGMAELIWYVEDKIAKSILLQTRSESSLEGNPTEPPAPQGTWVSEILDAAHQVQTGLEVTENLLSTTDVLPASQLADILNRGISDDSRSYINADGMLTLKEHIQLQLNELHQKAASAVKSVNDTLPDNSGNVSLTLPSAGTTTAGIVRLSDSVTDENSNCAATSKAVKLAYDHAETVFKRVQFTVSNITIPEESYISIGSYQTLGLDAARDRIVSMNIIGWTGGAGMISLALGSDQTTLYVLGSKQTTFLTISIEVWYSSQLKLS